MGFEARQGRVMTVRTSRIVVDCRSAPLRGSYTLASPTPCFVVSTVEKMIINHFPLGRRLFARIPKGRAQRAQVVRFKIHHSRQPKKKKLNHPNG